VLLIPKQYSGHHRVKPRESSRLIDHLRVVREEWEVMAARVVDPHTGNATLAAVEKYCRVRSTEHHQG
jgi:hypothetical protein